MDTTLLAPTCCICLHGTTIMLALVAYSLKPVKHLGPCKRMQHCWPITPNNTQQCCDLLHLFAWVLMMGAHTLKTQFILWQKKERFQSFHFHRHLFPYLHVVSSSLIK